MNRSSEYLIKSVEKTSDSFTSNLNKEIKKWRDLFNVEREENKVRAFFRNPNLSKAGLRRLMLEYETRLGEVKRSFDALCYLFETKLEANRFVANSSYFKREYLGKLYLSDLGVNETRARGITASY